MSVRVHPSAVVDSNAQLGENVEIEAFCMIGGKVCIGDNCKILHHATLEAVSYTHLTLPTIYSV